MKRIIVLLITLMLFSLNVFATKTAELKTSEYWLEKAKTEAYEEINLYSAFDLDEITYYAKHINDDVFYKKILDGKKFSDFIYEDKWDCIVDCEEGYEKDGYYFTKIVYVPNFDITRADTQYQTPLPLNDEWFAALDEVMLSGELGNIENVSFLSYDADNSEGARTYIGGEPIERDDSLWDNVTEDFYSAWFAYIESDKGEYLFPCVIDGDMGIESGKIYELYECAEIMNANMYVVEDDVAELVEDDTFWVYHVVAAICVLVVGVCVVSIVIIKKSKKLIKRARERPFFTAYYFILMFTF